MYRQEVPKYGDLLDLVADVNADVLRDNPTLKEQLQSTGESRRIDVERHGAIRLGTAEELATMRRIFNVMGMQPVGYYDLTVAGVPVHATAFRPTNDAALRANPFRVFTSLLRVDLVEDPELREETRRVLAARSIFNPRAIELLHCQESVGGLTLAEADEFVGAVLQTFSWHGEVTVSRASYQRLLSYHRLVADIVCFRGPHINHLTPRTLDIDEAQKEMPRRGIVAKSVIEGPPKRKNPILLRQTSFTALEEEISFPGEIDGGVHTARFGEIEQRGMALTPKGRRLYDALLHQVRSVNGAGSTASDYEARLVEAFAAFPDDLGTLRTEGLGFFHYAIADAAGLAASVASGARFDLERLCELGIVTATPIVYEDFLPVSAAGIFQSNLGGTEQRHYATSASRDAFEHALQAQVLDEMDLYKKSQQDSIDEVRQGFLAFG